MFEPHYPDFSSINLLLNEKFIIFTLRFKKCQKGDVFSSKLTKLREYGLIDQNYLLKPGPEGDYLSDGTYSLSDRGKRYVVYLRKQRFYRYLTPVIIAFLTTIATNLLKELWLPALLSLLQGQS